MSRHDIATALPWVREGTAEVLAPVDGLDDTDVGEPSLLAGWSRSHLVGHLARNGEALARLATTMAIVGDGSQRSGTGHPRLGDPMDARARSLGSRRGSGHRTTWTDLPPEVIDALADDGLEGLGLRDACPSAFLEPTDRTVTLRLGPAPEPSVVVGGPAAGLVAWLLGRDDGSTLAVAGGPLPVLPRWL